VVPRRDGQRLERAEATAGSGTGAAGLAAAAHRGGDGRSSGDGERLSEGGGDRGAPSGLGPAGRRSKSGHTDVHRLGRLSGGDGGARSDACNPGAVAAAAGSQPAGERVRAVPRGDRAGAGAPPRRRRDLPRSRRRPRLHRRLRQRAALRAPGPCRACHAVARRPSRDRDGCRGRGAGRLWRRRADGARPGEREVPPHAALRADAGLQPQVGAAARLALEQRGMGTAARGGLSPAGRRAVHDRAAIGGILVSFPRA